MSYQSLARTYRPEKFSDLIGQESVALALANAIKLGREPHAVIFSGVRGIGKTTTARLYAKALNCDQGKSPEPCGTCDSCHAIAGGYHEDVLEIDGASNNGVDEVRVLKETSTYSTQRSSYKIYIIDEVHMLSVSAFNALLKLLEEPPSQVVFIFATTELHKIPKTVQGRCQTFYLKKISNVQIADRVRHILRLENIPFEEDALPVIAREGKGSMRDALTFLDQAIALGAGQIRCQDLVELLGSISSEHYRKLLSALLTRSPHDCIQVIAELTQTNTDFTDFVALFSSYIRHALLLRELGQEKAKPYIQDLNVEETQALHALIAQAELFDLNRMFRNFMNCQKELNGSELDRFVFENYCLEWCLDPGILYLDEWESQIGKNQTPSPNTPKANPSVKSSSRLATELLNQPVPKPELSLRTEIELESIKAPIDSAETLVPASHPTSTPPVVSPREGLPASWGELIQEWKKKRPIQARKLEEVHVMEYSASRILLAVRDEGIVARTLLGKEEQDKIKKEFFQLFGFSGELTFIAALNSDSSTSQTDQAEILPESLLETRQRELVDKKTKLTEDIKNHPLTQAIVQSFGGEIVDVKLEI